MFLPRLNDAFCTYQFQVEQAIYGIRSIDIDNSDFIEDFYSMD